MTRVVVRPAGAGRESLVVAMLCAAIVATAGTVALIRARPADETALAAWRVDARDGLNAAEQGLNADLAGGAPDIDARAAEGGPPAPERLAEEALPPFMRDPTSVKRGGHIWTLRRDGDAYGYLGATAEAATARSALLRIATALPKPADGHPHRSPAAATVWVHPSATSVEGLSDERLIAAGWRQVTSHYDASVTRETR